MARIHQLITLRHLKTAVTQVKQYADDTFSTTDHNHDGLYVTEENLQLAISDIDEKLAGKADSEHEHTSANITRMVGYFKALEASEINENDSLNTAIGKLEKSIEEVSNKIHNHDGIYLKVNDTAVAARKLESPKVITIEGMVAGSATFDGSEDISINTTIADLSSQKITAMTGYIKPETTSEIIATDTLNTAIGKLEKSIESNVIIQATNEEVAEMLNDVFPV